MENIKLDLNHSNIKQEEIMIYASKVTKIHEELHEKSKDENEFLGWLDLPSDYDKKEVEKIKKCAKKIQKDSEVLVVIGIGGSYLGARAVIESLTNTFYNSLPKEQRKNVKLEPHIICAYFRIGNNGKCVDNFNSGGMVAPVDEKTGTVTQLAIDKQKNVYEKHPQTGETIKGFKFPYWNEAIELCKKACQEIPEMGYVGWDVAFTPEGPLFVEANEFPRT